MRLLHTFAVLGGDARQRYLAALLTASGFTVHTFAVPELQDTAASLEETVSQIDAVCLPTPAVTSGAITGLPGPRAPFELSAGICRRIRRRPRRVPDASAKNENTLL